MWKLLRDFHKWLTGILLSGLIVFITGCPRNSNQDTSPPFPLQPKLVWEVPLHDGAIKIAFDGVRNNLIVSHPTNDAVALEARDMQSGALVHRIGQGVVMAVNPKSARAMAMWAYGSKIAEYDLSSSKVIRTTEVPKGMRCVAVSPDGRKLALREEDGQLRILHGDTLSKPLVNIGAPDYPNFACFSPDGTLLASVEKLSRFLGKARYRAVVYDTVSGKPKCVINDAIGPFAFSPDSKALASRYRDGKVMVWDMKSGKVKTRLQDWRDIGAVRHIAFSPDGSLIATGGNGWHARKPSWLKQLFEPRTTTVSLGGGVALSEAKTGQTLWSATVSKYQTVTAMAFSPDGAYLAVATGRPKASLMMWRLK